MNGKTLWRAIDTFTAHCSLPFEYLSGPAFENSKP
jgi:hypothetical protein